MTCPKCEIHDKEKLYVASNETGTAKISKIIFNVTKAWELVKEHNVPVLVGVDFELLKIAVGMNDFDPQHLDHVNMNNPVMFAISPWMEEAPASIIVSEESIPREKCNAKNSSMYFFLDGSHRGARALRDGTVDKLKFVLLPKELTLQCMVSIEQDGLVMINTLAVEMKDGVLKMPVVGD